MTPKVLFLAFGLFSLFAGTVSAVCPKRAIRCCQWIMERFNWRVAPINEAREMLDNRILGSILMLLSLTVIYLVFVCRL